MASPSRRAPAALWLLVALLAFLAIGGLYGGLAMLADPSGEALNMAEVLPLLRVPDYRLPGLFLAVIMGLLPLVLIYALLARPSWSWAEPIARRGGHHWAWLATVALGIVLLGWLALQGLLIGFRWPIQVVTAANGLLILVCAWLPGVRRHFRRD